MLGSRRVKPAVDGGGHKPVSLGLELIVTSPAPPPSDATNYLGGVADVLEDKGSRGDMAHLGEFAHFALYRNDRQFHDVRYRWRARSGRPPHTAAAHTYARGLPGQAHVWRRMFGTGERQMHKSAPTRWPDHAAPVPTGHVRGS
jgi:hypothetical protein